MPFLAFGFMVHCLCTFREEHSALLNKRNLRLKQPCCAEPKLTFLGAWRAELGRDKLRHVEERCRSKRASRDDGIVLPLSTHILRCLSVVVRFKLMSSASLPCRWEKERQQAFYDPSVRYWNLSAPPLSPLSPRSLPEIEHRPFPK